jgi:hypothetical protein
MKNAAQPLKGTLYLAVVLGVAALPLHAQMQKLEPGGLSYEIRYSEKEPQPQGCLRVFFVEINVIGQWSIMAMQKCRTPPYCKIKVDVTLNDSVHIPSLQWEGIIPAGYETLLDNNSFFNTNREKVKITYHGGSMACGLKETR